MRGGDPARLDPEGACPTFVKPKPDPFKPKPGEQIAEQRIVVPGPKMRSLASADDGTPRSGCSRPRARTGPTPAPSMSLAPEPVSPASGAPGARPRWPASCASCGLGVAVVARLSPPPSSSPATSSPTGTPSRSRPSACAGWRRRAWARRSPARPISRDLPGRLAAHGRRARRADLHPHLQARVRARAVAEARRSLPALRHLSDLPLVGQPRPQAPGGRQPGAGGLLYGRCQGAQSGEPLAPLLQPGLSQRSSTAPTTARARS